MRESTHRLLFESIALPVYDQDDGFSGKLRHHLSRKKTQTWLALVGVTLALYTLIKIFKWDSKIAAGIFCEKYCDEWCTDITELFDCVNPPISVVETIDIEAEIAEVKATIGSYIGLVLGFVLGMGPAFSTLTNEQQFIEYRENKKQAKNYLKFFKLKPQLLIISNPAELQNDLFNHLEYLISQREWECAGFFIVAIYNQGIKYNKASGNKLKILQQIKTLDGGLQNHCWERKAENPLLAAFMMSYLRFSISSHTVVPHAEIRTKILNAILDSEQSISILSESKNESKSNEKNNNRVSEEHDTAKNLKNFLQSYFYKWDKFVTNFDPNDETHKYDDELQRDTISIVNLDLNAQARLFSVFLSDADNRYLRIVSHIVTHDLFYKTKLSKPWQQMPIINLLNELLISSQLGKKQFGLLSCWSSKSRIQLPAQIQKKLGFQLLLLCFESISAAKLKKMINWLAKLCGHYSLFQIGLNIDSELATLSQLAQGTKNKLLAGLIICKAYSGKSDNDSAQSGLAQLGNDRNVVENQIESFCKFQGLSSLHSQIFPDKQLDNSNPYQYGSL